MSGQRRALVTMIPFHVDRSSLGRKLICQFRISYGWPQMAMKLKLICMFNGCGYSCIRVRNITQIFYCSVSQTFYTQRPTFRLIVFDNWREMRLYKRSEPLRQEHRQRLLWPQSQAPIQRSGNNDDVHRINTK